MFFLANGLGANLDVDNAKGVWGVVLRALRSIFYELNTLIYKFIIYLYKLFETICNARFLDNETFELIATRVGVILGIVMLFRVMFNFIQILLEPDSINDKSKGAFAIIKKILLVLVMLGISSFFFETTYNIQRYIIKEKIIYKLLLPSDVEIDTDNFGAVLAARTFTSFYFVEKSFTEANSDVSIQCNGVRNQLINEIVFHDRFSAGNYCLNAWDQLEIIQDNNESVVKKIDGFIMDYNFLLQLAVGIGIAYLLISYVIMVGVRTIQLTILQIISPMAIISYLSPKQDNMFSKWWKIYFSTYIDIFIRVGIIYLVVYISAILLDSFASGSTLFWESVGSPTDFGTRAIIVVVIIISLLIFAKKAPDLLKELFPGGASKLGFGLQSPKAFLKDLSSSPLAAPIKMATAPIGLLAKKTIGGIDSATHGYGFKNGWSKTKGKFGGWVNKQREQYMPAGYEQSKQRAEGRKEVNEINNKWEDGAKIAKKLMSVRAGVTTYSDTNPNAWNKVLNGDTANKGFYDAIFKNDEFITSKMNVDRESDIEDKLRRGYQKIQAGGSFAWNGTTYDSTNLEDFSKIYDGQQKKVDGLKKVHDSMRKQYQQDAKVEDQFKFIKSNPVNPANLKNGYSSRGI